MKNTNGAMVISLDFELYWGLKDKRSLTKYGENILGARDAIPAILELFERYQIHATWATVGLLFAESKSEIEYFSPNKKPKYINLNLSPYHSINKVGYNEGSDPYHYGYSLIKKINMYSGQELATHTFSHYYCLEKGQTQEDFRDDIKSALDIAKKKIGAGLCSLVFPRNQFNQSYLTACQQEGIKTYRGNQKSWLYRARSNSQESIFRRILRLTDAYLNISGHHLFYIDITKKELIMNIPASRFLRPYSTKLRLIEPLKTHRIMAGLKNAAKKKAFFHLWWHPHNFGKNMKQNLQVLEEILKHHKKLRSKYNFNSLNMKEIYEQTI